MNNHQMSETFLLSMLLAVVGGFLDAYTYISRNHVFANAQTGNIVLLGLNLAERNYGKALFYIVPIFAFVAGIIISEVIRKYFLKSQGIHWRQIIILIEVAVLLLVAFIPQGKGNVFANVVISFVCAMQVQSFRKLEGNAYANTMCTGNLRSATELLIHFLQTKDQNALHKSIKYYGINGVFIFGAFIGTICTGMFHVKSVLFCSVILLVVFFLMNRKRDKDSYS